MKPQLLNAYLLLILNFFLQSTNSFGLQILLNYQHHESEVLRTCLRRALPVGWFPQLKRKKSPNPIKLMKKMTETTKRIDQGSKYRYL